MGLELTGVLVQLFMVWWNRQFKKKVDENDLKVRVYQRYFDDINVITNRTLLGLVENEGRVIQDENIAKLERDIKVDERSMLLIQSIGNSIHPFID